MSSNPVAEPCTGGERHVFTDYKAEFPESRVLDNCARCGVENPYRMGYVGSTHPAPPSFNRDELQVIDTALERFVDDDLCEESDPGPSAQAKLLRWFLRNPPNPKETP